MNIVNDYSPVTCESENPENESLVGAIRKLRARRKSDPTGHKSLDLWLTAVHQGNDVSVHAEPQKGDGQKLYMEQWRAGWLQIKKTDCWPKTWIGRTKVILFCVLLLIFNSILFLCSGVVRPLMSQPAFLRESILIIDMLLCSRCAISSGMYEYEHHDFDGNTNNSRIPFNLYQSWMRSDVAHFRFNDIATFFDHNPRWTYHLFADDNPNEDETIDGWIDQHIARVANEGPEIESGDGKAVLGEDFVVGPHFATAEKHQRIECAYSMLQGGASKVDLWRYLIIYHNGGCYADFDAVLGEAYMDEIIGVNDTLVTSISSEIEMDQHFIIASKHHPILARAVNETTEAILKMAFLHNITNGNSSLFYELGCEKILSKWKTHAVPPLNSSSGSHPLDAQELRALFDRMPYPRRYCTCHNLDHQIPYYYMDKLHAACITGPNAFKFAFHSTLYDDTLQGNRSIHGIRVFSSRGLSGRLLPKFVEKHESIWHSNRIEKVKDAGRLIQAWPSMGEYFIDFENDCWKQFHINV